MNEQGSLGSLFAPIQGFSASGLLTSGARKFFVVRDGCPMQDAYYNLASIHQVPVALACTPVVMTKNATRHCQTPPGEQIVFSGESLH